MTSTAREGPHRLQAVAVPLSPDSGALLVVLVLFSFYRLFACLFTERVKSQALSLRKGKDREKRRENAPGRVSGGNRTRSAGLVRRAKRCTTKAMNQVH